MREDVFELSMEPKWREDCKRAYSMILEMGGQIMTITEEEVDELICGAIDMHVHAFPDPEIDTGWDQVNIAKRATDAGMGGVVFKAHTFPTAATVPLVQQVRHRPERRDHRPRRQLARLPVRVAWGRRRICLRRQRLGVPGRIVVLRPR